MEFLPSPRESEPFIGGEQNVEAPNFYPNK